jgi:predicted lactoylglutathione lyase
MPTKLFVNLPVHDLDRSQEFFAALGLEFFKMAEGMASVIISEHTQVMLLSTETYSQFTPKPVADAERSSEVILVLGVEDRAAVDSLVDTALGAGAASAGDPLDADGRYQRAFFDPDGHHWAALCLV